MKRPLKANSYIVLIIGLGAVLFAAISINLIYKVRQVQQAVADEGALVARNELYSSINSVLAEAYHIGTNLSNWDEIHQQLHDPTYYVYWRDLRLKESEHFPAYLSEFQLYDANGKTLAELPYQSLPAHIPQLREFARVEEGLVYLYLFMPINSRNSSAAVAGYVGLRIDFLAAIKRLLTFSYVDINTLAPDTNTTFPFASLAEHLSYAIKGEPISSRIGVLLRESLRSYSLLLLAIFVLFYSVALFVFIRPIKGIDRLLAAIRHGTKPENLTINTHLPVYELDMLQASLIDYQRELDSAQARLDRQNIELWHLAHRDHLTGADNRRAFDEDWRMLVEMSRDKRIGVSLILFDCDFFKAINDTYGHTVGDQVIQAISRRIHSALRSGDKLYRLGGDEFVTLLLDSDEQDAAIVAQRCAEAVASHEFNRLGIKESIKLSIGIAHAQGTDLVNLSELPRQADVAMYHAKRSTRDKIIFYTPEIEHTAAPLISNRIVNAVLGAIESGTGLEMHYQAVVRCADKQIDFYESLARIRDDTGIISPADIFPIIMRRNLEVEFDRAVLRAVAHDLESGHIPSGAGISINISGALLGQQDFCEYFAPLTRYLKERQIIIEITETSFISHLQYATECLHQMRNYGFRVALDDFGSGYSSIRYLANMPVDIVKFDISMVQDMAKDERTRSIIVNTAHLIRSVGYQLVAEGIEDHEMEKRTEELQATHYQGYHYSRPVRDLSGHH